MKFLQKFIGFKLNESRESYVHVTSITNSIFLDDHKIDQEMIDTCDDIIRDFNEDYDTQFYIDITPYKESIGKIDKLRITCLSRNHVTNYDKELAKIRELRLELYKSLISYFVSIGYKWTMQVGSANSLNTNILFLHKDN